ncbi:hypothetical protein HXA31_03095 [Salipaludibacillus agaradhaerens]|uniref:Phage protein n=1 Tax=Salipaludibacillus agaradhaerens TaxID=76935 RepID=A0A9Q4B2K5_SALAG|nr:tail assembly chaperone [Salipaludibacillus agaradhaerens]MCR6097176.1 hypothetical protein [Salipaludibacillus agaradhaerens]MCR6113339.1 hypothetical protein [Salipaludibacillus agaradhaerens]
MATFEIQEKEYELKLTFDSVKYLNNVVEGGSLGLIGKAMMGDLDVFSHIVHAGLFHHGKNFSFKEVEAEIEKGIANETLDGQDVFAICNEVVTDSFFYKKQVNKLLADNPEAFEALKKLKS